MSRLELVKHQIDNLLGTPGTPYPIYNQKWLDDGGFIWYFQPNFPTFEEFNAAQAIYKRVAQPLLAQGISDLEQFLYQVRDAFLAESAHLSEIARQFMVESLLFQGDYDHLRYVVEANRIFAEVEALAHDQSLKAYKTELVLQTDDRTDYRQIVLAEFQDQFDILRTEQTEGNNYPWDTEEIIEILTQVHHQLGVSITGADDRVLEFRLLRPPNANEALWLGRELLRLSPERQEVISDYPRGIVAIGWD